MSGPLNRNKYIEAHFRKYELTFVRPMPTSRGVLRTHAVYVIAVRNQDGLMGLGECAPLPGLSPDHRPEFLKKLQSTCKEIAAGALLKELALDEWPAIRFGVETALLDARRAGQSALIVSPFIRGETTISNHGLILMAGAEDIWQQIVKKTTLGFRCIKMKIGALPFDEELSLLTRFRQQFPHWEYELRLDANGAFAPDEALDKIRLLAPFKVHSLEQPIPPGNWQDMARVCHHSPIPIALDEELIGVTEEAARRELLETIRPYALVLKPTLLGGIELAQEWLRAAQELGIAAWFNSALESNIGLNAIAQLVGALQLQEVQGLGTGLLYERNFTPSVHLHAGSLFFDTDFKPPSVAALSELELAHA